MVSGSSCTRRRLLDRKLWSSRKTKIYAYFLNIWQFITVTLHHISGPPWSETTHSWCSAPWLHFFFHIIYCRPEIIIPMLVDLLFHFWLILSFLYSLNNQLMLYYCWVHKQQSAACWFMVFGPNYNKCSWGLADCMSVSDERWRKMNGQALRKPRTD